MSVQLPEVVVVFYLGMLAHVALPDTRPSWASNPGSMPKDRFWPVVLVRECPQSRSPSQRLEIRSRNRTVYPNNRPPAEVRRARKQTLNDLSSATRFVGRVGCNQSSMAGFAAAHA
jgi:hypothetical protein